MKERSLRVATGIVMAVYLISTAIIGGWWLRVNVVAAMGRAIYELQRALRAAGHHAPVAYGWIYAAGFYPAWEWFGVAGAVALLFLCALASMVGSLRSEISIGSVVGAALWAIYPAAPMTALFLAVSSAPDRMMMIIVVGMCFIPAFLTDIFAYLVGGWLGKRKLSPRISPKKSVEGFVGGFLGAILGTCAVGVAAQWVGAPIAWWEFAVLGGLCGVADQAGDLWASLVKRACGIKDFGRILPGHGGVIDRLDGVFFCSIVVWAWMLARSVSVR